MRKTCAAALLTLAVPLNAIAEETSSEATIFLPEDFAQFAPLNARDMVQRIPGFRLTDTRGQNESRGLGQATENVLINGQRVSSKSSSAANILSRIPASTVERIELLEGAALDIPGLSGLVVNVIAEADGVSGTISYRARLIDGQEPLLGGGEISAAGDNGDLGWNFNLNLQPRGSAGTGEEILVDAAGSVLETRTFRQKNKFPELEGSLGLRWTPSSGLIANFNAEVSNTKRERREDAVRFPTGEDIFTQQIFNINETEGAEISGDVEFDVLTGRLKLIGVLAQFESPDTSKRARTDVFGNPIEESFFRQITDESEVIFRGEYNWPALGGSFDVSFESAENTLDSTSVLLESENGAPLTQTDIGEATVSVEESRQEGFLTYSRTFAENVQVQISVGAEVSEISSSGATGQTRTFTRPKGGVTLSWAYNDNTTLNARVNREVGQLDFFDFVSQLDLDDGENQVGNSDIVPEQSWRTEVELERQFGDWGAGNVIVFAEALEDIVDQVPIGDGEGPGNIDTGSRFGVQFEGTVNFDPLGIDGAQLVYSATFQDSQIDDPLTGESRSINREDLIEIDLEWRHDISGTDLAWGGEFSPGLRADTFRVDSIVRDRDTPGRMSVFVEHKDIFGLTGRAEVFRPFGDLEKQTRERFSPDRTGTLSELERTRNEDKPILILELTGKF